MDMFYCFALGHKCLPTHTILSRATEVLARGLGGKKTLWACSNLPEKWVFQIEKVAGLGACLVHLSNNTDVITLPER